LRRAEGWPRESPGSANAWLLLVTTKPPTWRDPLFVWRELPPALGEAHEGFFYPDPLGFWAEIRHWVEVLMEQYVRNWPIGDALAITTLMHLGDETARLTWAMHVMQPRLVLFLDDPSWHASGLEVKQVAHYVPDPHRKGLTYEGFWGRTPDGLLVGKSPQHPAAHKLYRAADMDAYLRAGPRVAAA